MGSGKLLGIDIGTQGTKAVLFDRRGRTLATAFRKSRLHQPAPGVVEEDPEYQFRTVCQCIAACTEDAGIAATEVAAIGIDGQMAGILGIGADGRHVTPYDSWLDTRCSGYIVQMRERAGDEIIRRTGGPASFNHGPKILWWRGERRAVYDRIVSFVQPGGYAVMRLCDLGASDAFVDSTYLHFSGLADNAQGVWDAHLCRVFDVPAAKLPRIVAPHAVMGHVAASVARRCGLVAGIPVIAGCGDTAASFLACGATRAGICVDVAGTASVFAATTRQFKADTQFQTLGWGQSAVPGLWHPYAYINGGGMNLEWFARELLAAGGSVPREGLQALDRAAARLAPQASDPVFVPHLGGRVSPSQPLLRGSWSGLAWSHTAAHLYRAMLEGVALEYCVYRDVLSAVNPELAIREIRVTGGGERSAAWSQIKADVLGVPLVQVSRHEGAPLGAALLAGYGVGLLPDLAAAASAWIKPGKAVRPNRRLRRHYAQRLARYTTLLDALRTWSTSQAEGQA
ncbi:MAG: FGGY family carbohydrate kinase [Pirellulaceae bacterium]|nr:FGGY family carbohydrate kinase [Pirellulaceae bacterium]